MTKRKSKSQLKKQRKALKIVLIVLIVLLVLSLVGFGFFFYLFGGLNTVDFTKDDKELGVNEEVTTAGVTNIALYGVDTRDYSKDTGLSDAIMVLTVDQDKNVIKMTSILRDSKVPVEGHGETKINAAYSYGGPTLAIKTLNQNFDLDIKEYVTVNFSQLADIVDAVGGVTLTLNDAEVKMANELCQQYFPGDPLIQSSGEVLLTGTQAVSYSRIRKIDSDNARASRQQNVMSGIFQEIKTMSKSEYPGFIHNFLSIVETSLSYNDIIDLSPIALNGFTIESYTIPDPAYETDVWGGIDDSGMWCWVYNLDNAANRIHSIIYGDTAAAADPAAAPAAAENTGAGEAQGSIE